MITPNLWNCYRVSDFHKISHLPPTIVVIKIAREDVHLYGLFIDVNIKKSYLMWICRKATLQSKSINEDHTFPKFYLIASYHQLESLTILCPFRICFVERTRHWNFVRNESVSSRRR